MNYSEDLVPFLLPRSQPFLLFITEFVRRRFITCQMVKGIRDPRPLPDPRPPTEVWKDRGRRIGNLWCVSDANCKTNTTIYVNICSLISSRCTCRALPGHTRRSQRGVVLPPKGLRSDSERESVSVLVRVIRNGKRLLQYRPLPYYLQKKMHLL